MSERFSEPSGPAFSWEVRWSDRSERYVASDAAGHLQHFVGATDALANEWTREQRGDGATVRLVYRDGTEG